MTSVRTTMKPPQIAERWGCSPESICAMIHRGELPAIKVGTGTKRPRHVIPIVAIEQIEREGTVRAEPSAISQPQRRKRKQIPRYV